MEVNRTNATRAREAYDRVVNAAYPVETDIALVRDFLATVEATLPDTDVTPEEARRRVSDAARKGFQDRGE